MNAEGVLAVDGASVAALIAADGAAAVVTGRTGTWMRFGDDTAAAPGRYTHVYVLDAGAWRFVSAQGTPISGD